MCWPIEHRRSVKKPITVIIVCMVQSSSGLLVVIAMIKQNFHFLGNYVGPMKKQVKVGSQKEMFLRCCMTDLSRVKEKRW